VDIYPQPVRRRRENWQDALSPPAATGGIHALQTASRSPPAPTLVGDAIVILDNQGTAAVIQPGPEYKLPRPQQNRHHPRPQTCRCRRRKRSAIHHQSWMGTGCISGERAFLYCVGGQVKRPGLHSIAPKLTLDCAKSRAVVSHARWRQPRFHCRSVGKRYETETFLTGHSRCTPSALVNRVGLAAILTNAVSTASVKSLGRSLGLLSAYQSNDSSKIAARAGEIVNWKHLTISQPIGIAPRPSPGPRALS